MFSCNALFYCILFDLSRAFWDLAIPKFLPLCVVTQIHNKFSPMPMSVIHGHTPVPGNIVPELPKDVVALLVGESFVVGLNYAFCALPNN